MSDTPDVTLTLAADARAPGGAQLLVIDGASATIVALPPHGVVALGRAPDCDVRLADAACSRRHAQLHLADGEVTLEDLGSHNGTRVNGERVHGRRALAHDDVIGIGPIKLVLHGARRAMRAALLDGGPMRERLAQEVERAVAYQRPLSVAVIAFESAGALAAGGGALATAVGLVDVVGVLDDRHLAIAMPERVPAAASAAAAQLVELVAGRGATAIGVAHCPADACRADALVAAARAAAAIGPGAHEAAECVVELALGDATALIADAAMLQVYDLIKRLAASDLTVLVNGETGAGKENVALALHAWSRRGTGPFVAINCASLPEALVESELFGHEKGAFSGAATAKAGRLEAAAGGTVFLDEIGELPLAAQAKLLRALESRKVTRLGALRETALDVRVVAATNRDLEAEVKAGRFREDLYFRLGGARVVLPPLRDRPRELAILARHFLARACAAAGRAAPELSAAAMAALGRHPWPGNVRELKNEMELAAATVTEATIEPWHLSERITAGPGVATAAASVVAAAAAPAASAAPGATPVTAAPAASAPDPREPRFRPIADELRDLERRRMQEALVAAGGVQKRAAELIGMPLRTFTLKYKQYGLATR